MAQLPSTGIETHPSGTGGLNALINGNWDALEAIFDEATTSASVIPFQAIAKAITRTDLTGLAAGDELAIWNGTNWMRRPAHEVLTPAASIQLDMDYDDARSKVVDITANLTLTTASIKAGATFQIVIRSDASIRTLTFPAGWVFVGSAAPANIAASKDGLLTLVCTSAADSGVIATWSVEP